MMKPPRKRCVQCKHLIFLFAFCFLAVTTSTRFVAGLPAGRPERVGQFLRKAHLLLWIPIHISEPDAHVHAAADCLFRRWSRPSLSGQTFDIVLTLAGGVDKVGTDDLQSRAASLESIIKASTRHLSPPPRVTSLPITLSADEYDVDEARGGRSSFAGPNELFYGAMILDDEVTGAGPKNTGNMTTPPAASLTSLSALIAAYAFVQVVETDCCATVDGWLDVLLQPMLDDPGLMISGSRGRGACWTGAEHDGCTPIVDATIPYAHLRDHINGNAMYRVGPELTRLATSARDLYGSTVPFDVAMHLVSGGGRAFDNGRAYSVTGLPVDEDRFREATYYGADAAAAAAVAFVHAPRRLRAPAIQAMLRRLDVGRPVTVVVVSMRPGGGVDQALLHRLHSSLLATKEARNAVYLVADEDGYAILARLAPMRVMMMDGSAGHGQKYQAARLLSALASMARAGLTTFTMGLDATVLQPYKPHLMALADGQPGKAWIAERALLFASALPGLLFVPGGERAGQFLEAWAEKGAQAAHPSIPIQNLANRHHLSLTYLPPDLFPPASSYAGPLWTDAARRNVATVVAWDGWQAPLATPAALSALGLWRSPSSTPFFHCANYSMLGTRPLPLTSPAAIHRSLSARASFTDFVQEQAIACAVLPGFRLATTGNVVPDETVLGGKRWGLLSNAVVFTSLADLEASRGGGAGFGDFVPFEYVARSAAALSNLSKKPASRTAACGATSCFFAPGIAILIDAALAALPPSYQCVLDTTRHAHREEAVLSLEEGRLGEVGRVVRQVAGGKKRSQPVFLTGAWRHVDGGQLTNSPQSAAVPKIITLADVPTPLSAPLDPISRLVRFGSSKSTTSLASSPWADVIEFAVCQGARSVHDLADAMPGTPLTPASALARRAALIPPAVLAEDLAALARWLGRPDRRSLASAQRAQLDLVDSPVLAGDFQDAVLAPSLDLARAVGAKVAMLSTRSVPWSSVVGEVALRRVYADHAALLPGSVEVLLGSPPASDNITLGPRLYPASVDVLHVPAHHVAVRALERVLDVAHGKAHILPTLQLPATVSLAQHGRLKQFAACTHSIVLSFLF